MPHLTGTTPTTSTTPTTPTNSTTSIASTTSIPSGTSNTGLATGLGIPGYAHPLLAPTEWGELTRPGTPVHWVALNVADGPGARPDAHCLPVVERLRTAGVRVLGHLDTARLGTAHLGTASGARAFGEVISEAHRYLDWYRVDGFLLDRCPTDSAALPEIRRTVGTLRALRDKAHIVLGHGTHPYPGYAECGDQLVTFQGSWSDYRWSQVAEWTADYPPDRFCHFVHGVPLGHLDEALRIARWQGAATLWFTDRTDGGGRTDPWETMPGYWDEIVSRIGTGVSE